LNFIVAIINCQLLKIVANLNLLSFLTKLEFKELKMLAIDLLETAKRAEV